MKQGNDTLRLESTVTVLIVDDDEVIREVCSLMITDAGGQALTASDGLEAVELFAEEKDRISCVVLDFTMPRLNGYETFLELERMSPGVKVIMISGLARTPEIEELCRAGRVEFIKKPFRDEELFGALSRVLGRKI